MVFGCPGHKEISWGIYISYVCVSSQTLACSIWISYTSLLKVESQSVTSSEQYQVQKHFVWGWVSVNHPDWWLKSEMWMKSWICSVTEEEKWSITPTNQWYWLVLDTHLLQAIKHKQRDSLDVNVVLRVSFPCTEAHDVQSRWTVRRENAVRCLQTQISPKKCVQQWTHTINKHNFVDAV